MDTPIFEVPYREPALSYELWIWTDGRWQMWANYYNEEIANRMYGEMVLPTMLITREISFIHGRIVAQKSWL